MRVSLPGVESMAIIQLSLSSSELLLAVPGRYRLQLRLPHRVRDEQASAKLYLSRQQLEVVLPVEQSPLPPVMHPLAAEYCEKEGQEEGVVEGTEGGAVQTSPRDSSVDCGMHKPAAVPCNNEPGQAGEIGAEGTSSQTDPPAGTEANMSKSRLRWLETDAQLGQRSAAERIEQSLEEAASSEEGREQVFGVEEKVLGAVPPSDVQGESDVLSTGEAVVLDGRCTEGCAREHLGASGPACPWLLTCPLAEQLD